MTNLYSLICKGWLAFAVLISVAAAADPVVTPKDPTRPLNAVDQSSGQTVADAPLQLSAIFMRGEASAVVINGRTLQRGDSINGVTITRIESGRVYFSGRRSGVLNLYPAVIKRKLQ